MGQKEYKNYHVFGRIKSNKMFAKIQLKRLISPNHI